MDADMAHDDVGQQGPPMDPDTLALSQHEWLQFEAGSAAAMRCRGGAILGEDTPWTRLFGLAELPSYRLITVEFLSTFRYRAHQAAVRVDEDAELPTDIEFSLYGQHFEMSIERFTVYLGIYYEPETVTDGFAQGLTQGEEGVMRPRWAQISDTPFTGHRVRATMIRDPLIRYIHRCIVTTISGRGQSQEWVTTTDLFYLHSLLAGRPCNLARCFSLYYASFYHRQECGTLWGGAFITHIARTRGMVDMLDDLQAIEPRKLDPRTIIRMKLAADNPGRGIAVYRAGRPPISAATGGCLARPAAVAGGAAAALVVSGAGGRVTAARGGGASAASTARLPCGAPDRAARGVAAPYCQMGRRVGPADGTREG
ncbi:hypothetical protein R6Q57_000978 [Mikania cordata]